MGADLKLRAATPPGATAARARRLAERMLPALRERRGARAHMPADRGPPRPWARRRRRGDRSRLPWRAERLPTA